MYILSLLCDQSTCINLIKGVKKFVFLVYCPYHLRYPWIRGREVRALSLGPKGPEFDPSMRLSV